MILRNQTTLLHYNKGFTLVELVLTLLLVSILSVLALPKFFSVFSFQAASFYSDLLNTVRYAQKIAVGMGCDVQVSVSTSDLTLITRDSCTSGTFTQDIRDPSSGSNSYTRAAPSNVAISTANFPIYFDRSGRSRLVSDNSISNATITINGRNINIVGETGYVYE